MLGRAGGAGGGVRSRVEAAGAWGLVAAGGGVAGRGWTAGLVTGAAAGPAGSVLVGYGPMSISIILCQLAKDALSTS